MIHRKQGLVAGQSMAHLDITQDKANHLILMPKRPQSKKKVRLPTLENRNVTVALECAEENEGFHFDLVIRDFRLNHYVLQTRWKSHTILLRLELRSDIHRNPDGEEIGPDHLHVYRYKNHDEWAYPVPCLEFPLSPINQVRLSDPADFWQTVLDYLVISNITECPNFVGGLFT